MRMLSLRKSTLMRDGGNALPSASTSMHTHSAEAHLFCSKKRSKGQSAAWAPTFLGHDVELAEVLFALGIDELEGVDAVALHVGPVGRDTVVIQQPRQLQARHTQRVSTPSYGGIRASHREYPGTTSWHHSTRACLSL